MYTVEGVSNVANFITAYEESLKKGDSHFLSEICFQRQSFLLLFYYTAAGVSAVWRP